MSVEEERGRITKEMSRREELLDEEDDKIWSGGEK